MIASLASAEIDRDPLARVELFAALDVDERLQIARLCRWQRFSAGSPVIDETMGVIDETTGDRLDRPDVLFVIDGRARVVNQAANGRVVTFAEVGPGAVVGELAAIDGGPRTATVRAETDCRVAKLSAERFHLLLERYPAITRALLRRLVRVVRNADQRISELSTLGAASRLSRELLRRAQPAAGQVRTDAPGRDSACQVEPIPTQEQLASLTGATRETVARLLAQWQHGGLVRRAGSRLVILDRLRLAEIAELDKD